MAQPAIIINSPNNPMVFSPTTLPTTLLHRPCATASALNSHIGFSRKTNMLAQALNPIPMYYKA
jgi:hypothetical protein